MASQQMDLQKACDVLGLTKDNLDSKSIRRAYMTAALRYHPDKNPLEGKKFTDVGAAYEFLQAYLPYQQEECECDDADQSYSDLLASLIRTSTGVSISTENLSKFFVGVRSECDQLLCNAINGMQRDDAISVYGYVSKFKDVIGVSDDVLSSLEGIIKTKMESDELVVLRPAFSQLFEPNLFPLEHKGEKYFVPLWHEEVEFDLQGKALIVRVTPDLPNGTTIDDAGCVTVEAKTSVQGLLSNGFIDVEVGPEKIRVLARDVLVKPVQTLVFKGRGIVQMDCQNILNAAGRGDVRVRLELTR